VKLGIGVVVLAGAVYGVKKLFVDDKSTIQGGGKGGKSYTSLFPAGKSSSPKHIDLPSQVPYLIIGAGTAAFAAYRAIRASDATAQVLMLGEETYAPYQRPPLSKELWYSDSRESVSKLNFKQWNGKERSIFYEKDGFYCSPSELTGKQHGGVALANGLKVVKLDVKERKAFLNDGRVVGFSKCLIATGGKPRSLSVVDKAGPEVLQRTTLFRSVDDFKRLYDVTGTAKSLAIVGGGFLGSELACALGKRGLETGMKVTQIFPESGNMGLVLPEYLSKWATEKVRKEGVHVLSDVLLDGCSFDSKSKQIVLKLSNGKQVSVDHLLVAVGLEPSTELADSSGLEKDPALGGFLVNAELEARSNVWVAGDAACFYDVKLGRRRVEHHDHAVVSGRLAGENMAGAGKPYWHQSMFWSDLGPEVGYEAIGLVDSRLETVSVFALGSEDDTPRGVVEKTGEGVRSITEEKSKVPSGAGVSTTSSTSPAPGTHSEDYTKGVIFYLRDSIVVGVVMWNVFNKMPIARQLIKEGKKYDDLTEVAKLFNLYGDPDHSEDPPKSADPPALVKPDVKAPKK